MKKIWYSIKDYVYIVLIVVLIRTFLITPAAVSGSSMESTLNNHDLVIINKLVYRIARNELSRLCWWLKVVYCHVNDPFARADKHSDRESHTVGNEVEMCSCITDILSDFINQRIITSMTGHAENPPTGAVKHFIMVELVMLPANRNTSNIRFVENQVDRNGNTLLIHVDNITCTNDTHLLFQCLKFVHLIQGFSFSCILNHAHNL